jgi:hypothetical protein
LFKSVPVLFDNLLLRFLNGLFPKGFSINIPYEVFFFLHVQINSYSLICSSLLDFIKSTNYQAPQFTIFACVLIFLPQHSTPTSNTFSVCYHVRRGTRLQIQTKLLIFRCFRIVAHITYYFNVRPSIRMYLRGSHWTDFCVKSDTEDFYENMSRKSK